MRFHTTGFALALLAAGCAAPRTNRPASADGPEAVPGATFDSPKEAMDALVASAEDPARADALLGPGGADLLCGCDAEDGDDLATVRQKLHEHVAFADVDATTMRVLLGSDGWELPLRIVQVGNRWGFDLATAQDEMLCRAIGADELRAIAMLHELCNVQREYSSLTQVGERPVYAQRWSSTPGHHDGLYWESAEGEAESPLGAGVCGIDQPSDDPAESPPCHGYTYKILKARGAEAAGGAKSYVDDGKLMTAGFAFVAWPTEYRESGVMTFLVDEAGIVFQKDLGPDTAQTAAALTAFDADASWLPARD